MKRYNVPRLIFINKMDRNGANPFRAIEMIRNRLGMKIAAVQIPIGVDSEHTGLIDLITMKGYLFEGDSG